MAGSASTSGPRSRTRYATCARGCPHGVLERADGRVRVATIRRGTHAVAQAVTVLLGIHGRGRRRLRPSRRRARPSRPDQLDLDRRRSRARIPRRPYPSGRCPRFLEDLNAHRRKLEDVQRAVRGFRFLRGPWKAPRGARRSRCGRLPAVGLARYRPWRHSPGPESPSTHRTPTGSRAAHSPARSHPRCSPSSEWRARSWAILNGDSYFGETDETTARRASHALDAGPRGDRLRRGA